MRMREVDVVVLGGGAAGVPAAIAAAEMGAAVALVERGPIPGGELIGGLPILGCANGEGEWIVRGFLERCIGELESLGGFVGLLFDWRTMWGACFDPELMKLVVTDQLASAGVRTHLGTQAIDVVRGADGRPDALIVHDGRGMMLLRARAFVDASGDAWLAERLGAAVSAGDGRGGFQPVSLTFRLSGVDLPRLLAFVADHPEELIVAENPFIRETPAEAARAIAASGRPFFSLSAEKGSTRLHAAIEDGRMFPTTAYYTWPTSVARGEVGLNVTRVSGVDGTDTEAVSAALGSLVTQVQQAQRFLVDEIPGYESASLSGVSGRVGIRETRRIVGQTELTEDDVLGARRHPDGVARGSHHVDVHGDGTFQLRRYIPDGGSYDIPLGSLRPRDTDGVVVAGRCLSSTREANGSARVMGSCIAMGEAAGVVAGLAADRGVGTAAVPAADVREVLRQRGALVPDEVA